MLNRVKELQGGRNASRRSEMVRQHLLGQDKLHLGSGPNLLQGWANLDLEGPLGTIECDLTKPLPLTAGSIRYVYSEHFIEHITREEALRLLSNVHAAMAPGGVIRLSTPDLAKAVAEYQAGRLDEWHDMGWKPETPCRLMNEVMRLWGHQFVYDWPEMKGLLEEAGFCSVQRMMWRESEHPELKNRESRPFHTDLIVEAVKR